MNGQASWTTELDDWIASRCRQWQVPGMAFVVARDGQPIYRNMYGSRDVGRELPVTEDTVFGVASITKSMTALAVMQLEDEGKLSVNDLVLKWLPELQGMDPDWTERVRVHHLLTHTSGLPGMAALFRARAGSLRLDPDWRLIRGDLGDPFAIQPIRTYIELMHVLREADIRFLGEPGWVFNYSNEGYALLQGIIERASGRGFLEQIQEFILDPLEMRHAVLRTEDLARLPEVTELYAMRVEESSPADSAERKRIVFHSPAWWDVGDIYTNGSLKASASDMLKYLEVYRLNGVVKGHRLISAASLAKMMTPHVALPTGRSYGYGLHVDNYAGATMVGHGGGIKGVSSDVVVVASRGVTAVALINLAGVPVAQLATAGVNAALGLPLDQRIVPYPDDPSASQINLDAYLGRYASDEGGRAEVGIQAGKLVVTVAGQQNIPLRAYARDGFVDAAGNVAFKFIRGVNDQVIGLFSGVRFLGKTNERG